MLHPQAFATTLPILHFWAYKIVPIKRIPSNNNLSFPDAPRDWNIYLHNFAQIPGFYVCVKYSSPILVPCGLFASFQMTLRDFLPRAKQPTCFSPLQGTSASKQRPPTAIEEHPAPNDSFRCFCCVEWRKSVNQFINVYVQINIVVNCKIHILYIYIDIVFIHYTILKKHHTQKHTYIRHHPLGTQPKKNKTSSNLERQKNSWVSGQDEG